MRSFRWPSLHRPFRRLDRHLTAADPSASLVHSLGLLGIAAALVGAITYPLVDPQSHPELVGLALFTAAAAGSLLAVLPGRWISPLLASLAVIGSIALQTLFAAITGGVSSPYRAGFVAVVLLVAFFTRPSLAVATALLGIAGMVVAGVLHGGIGSSEVASVAMAGLLTLMVAISTSQLAAWQRNEQRRLGRRIDRVRLAAEARRAESFADALTGAHNRRRFDRDLQQLLATPRAADHGALLSVDLDGLKAINDTHGHPMGDRAIVAIADALRELLRSGDRVYRVGGDEFAVLFPGASVGELASRLPESLPVDVPGVGEVRASLGMVQIMSGDRVADVMRRVDERLYEAKRRRQAHASSAGLP